MVVAPCGRQGPQRSYFQASISQQVPEESSGPLDAPAGLERQFTEGQRAGVGADQVQALAVDRLVQFQGYRPCR